MSIYPHCCTKTQKRKRGHKNKSPLSPGHPRIRPPRPARHACVQHLIIQLYYCCTVRMIHVSIMRTRSMVSYSCCTIPVQVRTNRPGTHRNDASKRPLGCYDFVGVKRRPGAFTVWSGRFLKKCVRHFGPGAIQKKRDTHTHLTHTATALTSVYVGTGDTVVAGVGIADGSRAKYYTAQVRCGRLTQEQQCREIVHYIILALALIIFFNTD